MGARGPKSDKEWAQAIRRAAHRVRKDPKGGESRKAIDLLAERAVDDALNGSPQMMQEVGNRLDGRAPQSMELKHDVSDPIKELLRSIDGATRGLPSSS